MKKTEKHSTHIPPQAIDAEESVIASCLMGDWQEVVEILKPADFYRTAHEKIFSSICALASESIPVELVSVVNYLRGIGQLDQAGGASYIASLLDSAPVSTNIRHHVSIIKEKAARRRLIQVCNVTIQKAVREDIDSLLNQAERNISGIELASANTFSSCGEIVELCIDRLDAVNTGKIAGIPSGYADIDKLTCGWEPGELIILAARPGMGKSALAVAMAKRCAYAGYPVAIFTLEMSKIQLINRLLATEARVDLQKFKSGGLSQAEMARITDAAERLYEMPIFIDATATIHQMEIRRRTRALKKKHDIKLVIVDYLQLASGDGERRDLEIGDISRGLKALANDFEVPVIALSQLNRKLEERHDKRPQLSDLRESGALEQDADIVVFIYRDEVYSNDPKNPNKGVAEIIFAKYRNGKTGKVYLSWHGWRTTFEDMARDYHNKREGF